MMCLSDQPQILPSGGPPPRCGTAGEPPYPRRCMFYMAPASPWMLVLFVKSQMGMKDATSQHSLTQAVFDAAVKLDILMYLFSWLQAKASKKLEIKTAFSQLSISSKSIKFAFQISLDYKQTLIRHSNKTELCVPVPSLSAPVTVKEILLSSGLNLRQSCGIKHILFQKPFLILMTTVTYWRLHEQSL